MNYSSYILIKSIKTNNYLRLLPSGIIDTNGILIENNPTSLDLSNNSYCHFIPYFLDGALNFFLFNPANPSKYLRINRNHKIDTKSRRGSLLSLFRFITIKNNIIILHIHSNLYISVGDDGSLISTYKKSDNANLFSILWK